VDKNSQDMDNAAGIPDVESHSSVAINSVVLNVSDIDPSDQFQNLSAQTGNAGSTPSIQEPIEADAEIYNNNRDVSPQKSHFSIEINSSEEKATETFQLEDASLPKGEVLQSHVGAMDTAFTKNSEPSLHFENEEKVLLPSVHVVPLAEESRHEHSQGRPQKKPASVIDKYESTRMLKELLDQKEASESSAKALVNLISLEFIYF
jgi:hypothetical protein